MDNEYIVILNYNTGECFYRKLTSEDKHLIDTHIEEFFNKYNMNDDECSWMFTATRPILTRID